MTDPTPQGPLPGLEADRYSLAEIDAHCRKAARGAGCPWGLAEEAGKAARWLAAHGLPGPEALAGLLQGPRTCTRDHVPRDTVPRGGDAGPECGLRHGAALSDRAERIAAGEAMEADVAQPLLVLALMGRTAAATGACFALDWDGGRAVCSRDGIMLDAPATAIATTAVAPTAVRLRVAALVPPPARCGVARRGTAQSRPVDPAAWAVLDRFAARTYVPATDDSRRTGAGAGLTDKD